MDISNFSINESPIAVTLRNPESGEDLQNDKGAPMQIFVVGADSAAFRRIKSESFAKNRKAKNIRFEQAEAQSFELLAKATTEFKNLMFNGSALEYSVEAAIDLYRKFPWIKEQVDEAIVDRANFLENSGKD